uniref:Uncharacterized protein n=1 Tax=Anguilla anguilla TaxID=7936 RepID=A0A0E9QBS9_ANGAN
MCKLLPALPLECGYQIVHQSSCALTRALSGSP